MPWSEGGDLWRETRAVLALRSRAGGSPKLHTSSSQEPNIALLAAGRSPLYSASRSVKVMSRFVRVMHPSEAEEIRRSGIIPTNREAWAEHQPGTVVFLFDGDRVPWAYIRSRADDLVEECGEAVILSFQGALPLGVDKSGWAGGGAAVHDGSIRLSDVGDVCWCVYSKRLRNS